MVQGYISLSKCFCPPGINPTSRPSFLDVNVRRPIPIAAQCLTSRRSATVLKHIADPMSGRHTRGSASRYVAVKLPMQNNDGLRQALKSSKTMRDLRIGTQGSVSDLLLISRRFHAVSLPRKTYVTPIPRRYFNRFMYGFDEKLIGGNMKNLHMPR